MSKKSIYIILCIIVSVAAVLRLWKLGSVPISPDWDEVALGYNAYSIMETGRDEFGKLLPFILRSFNDYKPALYAYITIPFIKLIGLTVFSVRLPSAILGILAVAATYFLVRELLGIHTDSLEGKDSRSKAGLLVAALLAISPWHIQFSRVAFEANAGVALNIFAVLFFLKGLKKSWYLYISISLFALSLYTYQSEKVFILLLLLVLCGLFAKQWLFHKKLFFAAIGLGILISLPIAIFTLTSQQGLARAKEVSLFSKETTIDSKYIDKLRRDRESGDTLGIFLDSPQFVYSKRFIDSYLSHFDANWLFIKGDKINRHHAPNMALLYLWELPFLLIGFYQVIFGKFNKSIKILLFSWFLIAPIPAAFTISDVPHAVRTLNVLPTFQIFTAIGLMATLSVLRNTKFLVYTLCFLLLLFLGNIFYYVDQYFVQQNYYYAKDWQYGYKELIDYIAPIKDNYKKIIVSNKERMDQSYMFFLFYLQYSPKAYLWSGGTSGAYKDQGIAFSNFEFRQFDYTNEVERQILLIGSPSDFPTEVKPVKTIDDPDGQRAILVVEK